MTDQPDDELRALRERAYGRHADIHDDPAAMARLRELEDEKAVLERRLHKQAKKEARKHESARPLPRAGRQTSGQGRMPPLGWPRRLRP